MVANIKYSIKKTSVAIMAITKLLFIHTDVRIFRVCVCVCCVLSLEHNKCAFQRASVAIYTFLSFKF